MDEAEITELVSKGLWKGHAFGRSAIFQQFSAVIEIAIRTDISMMTGAYHIESDKLCVSFRPVLLNLPDFGYINPGNKSKNFTWETHGEVYWFSIGH